MKKTLIYLVILAILGFGVYYFLFNNNANPYTNDEAGFNIKDTATIGRIFISKPSENSNILAERTDSGWVVNKRYKALPSTLNTLLATLAQQTPLYPVPASAHNNVIKVLSGSSIKVELYSRSGNKMKTFYVGGEAAGGKGTYMLMDGAKRPYVVQINNFDGYLTPRYTSNMKDWRDRTVFNFAPDQIKQISMQYYDHPVNSFVLTRNGDKITVTGDTDIVKKLDNLNERRANVYLKFFQNINCEGYLDGAPDIDSLIKVMPKQSSIDVTANNGQHQHVDIYWMPINKRSKNLTMSNPDVPDDYDADRFFAVTNNYRDTMMIQRHTFKPMFRAAYQFYQKDGASVPDNEDNKPNTPSNVLIHR